MNHTSNRIITTADNTILVNGKKCSNSTITFKVERVSIGSASVAPVVKMVTIDRGRQNHCRGVTIYIITVLLHNGYYSYCTII